MKKLISVWVFFFFIIFIFYRNFFNSYFEGDEWYYFSIFLPLTRQQFGLLETFVKSFTESNSISGGGHVAPLYNVIWFLQNKFFGLNFSYYIFFSFLVHASNSFLLSIFVGRVTRNKLIAFLSGTIFAISCVHYEAITWVMAVVPTQISLLFILGGLICFVSWTKKGAKKDLLLFASIGLFLTGMFTKESVIGVVFIAPLLALPSGKKIFLMGVSLSAFVMLIYLPIRFGIPMLVDQTHVQSTFIPLSSLVLYQILLIERIITEVFVSSSVLIVISRFISENLYLRMSLPLIQKDSIELFSQSIGADILLFMLSPIFFVVCYSVLLKVIRKAKNYEILLFSILLIVSSAFPLLFVLKYAPWWIDGAFIDSRHLYLPSAGASILLGYGVYKAYGFFSKRKLGILTMSLFSLTLSAWIWNQYVVIEQQADRFEELARSRLSLIKSIQSYLPNLPRKAVILVESDTPYFGFGQIPPFQTNLGQVLAVTYYDKNQLPAELFSKAKYMEKGMLGEGVVVSKGRTFGYYLHKNNLLRDLGRGKFAIEDVYGYAWHGGSDELIDKTNETREFAINYTVDTTRTDEWKLMEVPNWVKFSYPTEGVFLEIENTESNVLKEYELKIKDEFPISIKLETKSNKLPFHDYLRLEKKSDKIPINAEYFIKNIFRIDGTPVTTVHLKTGEYVRYMVPFSSGIGYLEISTLANQNVINEDDKYTNKNIELLLSTVYF